MASSIGILNTLSITQREVFLRYARSCADRYSVEIGSLRGNLVYRDRVYQRQIDATAESRATVRESMKGKPRVLRDVTLPQPEQHWQPLVQQPSVRQLLRG